MSERLTNPHDLRNQILLENCHEDLEKALLLLADRALPSIDEDSIPTASTSRLQQSQPPPSANHHLSAPANGQAYRTHHPRSSSSNSTSPGDGTDEDDPTSRELKSVIESPLAVLAHISSLKVSESTEEESGKRFLPNRTDRDPNAKEEGGGAGTAAAGYFATGVHPFASETINIVLRHAISPSQVFTNSGPMPTRLTIPSTSA